MKRTGRPSSPGRYLTGTLIVFFAAAFCIPAAFMGQDHRLYILGASVAGSVFLGGSRLFSRLLSLDRILSVLSLTLCGLSILIVALADVDAAHTLAIHCAGALVLMVAGSFCSRAIRPSVPIAILFAFIALMLFILPLCISVGNLPCRAAMVFLMIAFVILLSVRKEIPAVLAALCGVFLLLAQKDLADASVWSVTFLLLFWAYSGHPAILLSGVAIVGLAGYGAYLLLPDLFERPEASSLFVSMDPGLWGLEWTDPFFAVMPSSGASLFPWMAARFGWISSGCILLFFPVIIVRGTAIARGSRSRLHGMIAMGAVIMTGLYTVIALISDFGIWQFPGLSLPGLTNDPLPLVVFMFLMGLTGSVSRRNEADLAEDEHIGLLSE